MIIHWTPIRSKTAPNYSQPEPDVLSEPDFAHPTRAETGEHAIMGNSGSDHSALLDE